MKQLKWAGKLAITVALLYWVFRQTDLDSIAQAMGNVNQWWLAVAFVPYLFSRVVSAFRLTAIVNRLGIPLSIKESLWLHWESMFYGMFLPGGLGGDAYKLIAIKKGFASARTKDISLALLWDRLIGFAVLLAFILLTSVWIWMEWRWIGAAAAAVSLGTFILWFVIKTWFPVILPILPKLLWQSLVNQLTQVASILILLVAIDAESKPVAYIFLFLVSSVASMLPVSIGGVGIRELVFMKGSQWLALSETSFVLIGVLFDLIVTVSALSGGFAVLFSKEKREWVKAEQP